MIAERHAGNLLSVLSDLAWLLTSTMQQVVFGERFIAHLVGAVAF